MLRIGGVPLGSALALSGCATPSSTAGGQSPDESLKTAVHAYSAAYLGGHGAAAYSLLSARCQQVITLAQMVVLSGSAQPLYGDVPIKTITVDVEGNHAAATYTHDIDVL